MFHSIDNKFAKKTWGVIPDRRLSRQSLISCFSSMKILNSSNQLLTPEKLDSIIFKNRFQQATEKTGCVIGHKIWGFAWKCPQKFTFLFYVRPPTVTT